MLDREGIWEIAKKQLALDYCCSEEDLRKPGILVREGKRMDGRRIYDHDGCFLKILCLGTGAVVATRGEMIPWIGENLAQTEPSWLFEYPVLRRIDKQLKSYGQEIADVHQYYLPNGDGKKIHPRFPVIWHEADAILEFEGDERFGEAFVFGAAYPNILGRNLHEGIGG